MMTVRARYTNDGTEVEAACSAAGKPEMVQQYLGAPAHAGLTGTATASSTSAELHASRGRCRRKGKVRESAYSQSPGLREPRSSYQP